MTLKKLLKAEKEILKEWYLIISLLKYSIQVPKLPGNITKCKLSTFEVQILPLHFSFYCMITSNLVSLYFFVGIIESCANLCFMHVDIQGHVENSLLEFVHEIF